MFQKGDRFKFPTGVIHEVITVSTKKGKNLYGFIDFKHLIPEEDLMTYKQIIYNQADIKAINKDSQPKKKRRRRTIKK